MLSESHEADRGEYSDRFDFTETSDSTPQRWLLQDQTQLDDRGSHINAWSFLNSEVG